MPVIVLLGDSIFDNAKYVPGEPAVIDQVRKRLPTDWNATLLAVDGHCTDDVERQLTRMPASASHLFVSVGGNDALGAAGLLEKSVRTVGEALGLLYAVQTNFAQKYGSMLRSVRANGLPVVVCTIYDAVPHLGDSDRMALTAFNEVILREAFVAGLPVIDLRLVCDHLMDYSRISPIEPSRIGGSKISERIVYLAMTHDFRPARSTIYT